jgi:Uri superfamily endonuclease
LTNGLSEAGLTECEASVNFINKNGKVIYFGNMDRSECEASVNFINKNATVIQFSNMDRSER